MIKPETHLHRPSSILCFLLILLITNAVATVDDDAENDPFETFLFACSEGNMEVLEILLEEHPDFAKAHSSQGETCLHAAGILGQVAVTNAVLKAGGSPNQRSTFVQGLRMTPLSWNVFGGHVENAKALLEAGADVNMDFDHMTKNGEELVTVLDILYMNTQCEDGDNTDMSEHPHCKEHYLMRDLLLEYGARRYADLEKKDDEL